MGRGAAAVGTGLAAALLGLVVVPGVAILAWLGTDGDVAPFIFMIYLFAGFVPTFVIVTVVTYARTSTRAIGTTARSVLLWSQGVLAAVAIVSVLVEW